MKIRVSPCCWLPALAAAVVLMPGCNRQGRSSKDALFQMGQPVNVGSLTYTALESEWRDTLETPNGSRTPKNRFLLIRLSVTNGGGVEAGVPLLNLVDAKNNEHLEEDKGDGVQQWFGLLRLIKPGSTDEGYLLFDVPPATYRLRVSTGGDPEKEVVALVDIPFKLDMPQQQPGLPIAPPPKQ